mgnify:CR=1 FL=1
MSSIHSAKVTMKQTTVQEIIDMVFDGVELDVIADIMDLSVECVREIVDAEFCQTS